MKTISTRVIVLGLIVSLTALFYGCAPAQKKSAQLAPSTATPLNIEALGKKRILLVSHPSPLIVRTLHALVKEGQLPTKGLLVLGLHHAQERERYGASRAYLKENGIHWMAIRQLRCAIDADSVFRENGCTPVFRALMRRTAGVIFFGGADIPPVLYGEKTLLTTVIRTPHRQYWEISFLAQLLGSSRNEGFAPLMKARPDFPILGICMGLQAMNVATGGTLIQDIPSEVYGAKTFEALLAMPKATLHRSAAHRLRPSATPSPGVFHPIIFSGADAFWARLHPHKEPVSVISIHHQAVEKVGANLEVIATSLDGKVVEAMRHTRFSNVLAVQFHPEYYFLDRATAAAGKAKRRIARDNGDPRVLAFHQRFWRHFVTKLQR